MQFARDVEIKKSVLETLTKQQVIANLEESKEDLNISKNDKISINGTEIRRMFLENKVPPTWYMRSEISNMIVESIKAKEDVFV